MCWSANRYINAINNTKKKFSRRSELPEVRHRNWSTTDLCAFFASNNNNNYYFLFVLFFFLSLLDNLFGFRMRGDETDSDSGRSDEGGSIQRSLETLCQELNMDEETAEESLRNFTSIWNTYTLEVREPTRAAS